MNETTNVARYASAPQDDNMPLLIPSIFARMFLLVISWGTITLAIKTPASLTAVLIKQTGLIGDVAASVFLVAFSCLLLDILVHDALPKRYRPSVASKWSVMRGLSRLWRWRWLTASSMSLVYLMFAAIGTMTTSRPDGSWVLLVYYTCVAGISMSLALYSKINRYNNQMGAHRAAQETAQNENIQKVA